MKWRGCIRATRGARSPLLVTLGSYEKYGEAKEKGEELREMLIPMMLSSKGGLPQPGLVYVPGHPSYATVPHLMVKGTIALPYELFPTRQRGQVLWRGEVVRDWIKNPPKLKDMSTLYVGACVDRRY